MKTYNAGTAAEQARYCVNNHLLISKSNYSLATLSFGVKTAACAGEIIAAGTKTFTIR